MTETAQNSKADGFMILLFQEHVENGLLSFPAYFHILKIFFLCSFLNAKHQKCTSLQDIVQCFIFLICLIAVPLSENGLVFN